MFRPSYGSYAVYGTIAPHHLFVCLPVFYPMFYLRSSFFSHPYAVVSQIPGHKEESRSSSPTTVVALHITPIKQSSLWRVQNPQIVPDKVYNILLIMW